MNDISFEKIKPANWDPSLDAVAAAPHNHQVLYEDDVIRVLSVSVQPGETEPLHHHRWPSVFVIDRMAKLRHFDSEGREAPLPFSDKDHMPLIVKVPPRPPHFVTNEDSVLIHGTRIEFKQGWAP